MPRLTIQFPDEVDEILKALAKRKNTTKVDILRRALSLYNYVEQETNQQDRKLAITDEEDRSIKELIFQ